MIYIAYTFAILFLVIVFRTAASGRFTRLWHKKKEEIMIQLNVEQSTKKGHKAYYFDKGTVEVWAKNYVAANAIFTSYKRKKISDGIVGKHKK